MRRSSATPSRRGSHPNSHPNIRVPLRPRASGSVWQRLAASGSVSRHNAHEPSEPPTWDKTGRRDTWRHFADLPGSVSSSAGLTSTTEVTPAIAWLMLSGMSRSPTAISTPASAIALPFSGSRTSTRTGTWRCVRRRAASDPTFPAVVTSITLGISPFDRCHGLLMVAAAFWTASCAVVAGRPMSFTRSSLAVNNSPRARPASASATAAAISGGSPAAVRALV